MNWFKVTELMPPEKEFFLSFNNYWDKKDRRWIESKRVLVVDDRGNYFVDSTMNGKFISENRKDCDGFTHYVVAWMPILPFRDDD